MKTDIPEIVDNPKEACESFIRELETYYYSWYDGTSTRNYYVWFAAQAMSLLAGFATALIAALLGTEQFKAWSSGRILLVVLPVLGSLASTYLLQSRIGELAALREARARSQALVRVRPERAGDPRTCATRRAPSRAISG
jgi:hypothetical protein